MPFDKLALSLICFSVSASNVPKPTPAKACAPAVKLYFFELFALTRDNAAASITTTAIVFFICISPY